MYERSSSSFRNSSAKTSVTPEVIKSTNETDNRDSAVKKILF